MFLIPGGGRIIGGGLGTSFASTLGSIMGVNAGSEGGTMVGLSGDEKYVASLGPEYLMCDENKPVEF